MKLLQNPYLVDELADSVASGELGGIELLDLLLRAYIKALGACNECECACKCNADTARICSVAVGTLAYIVAYARIQVLSSSILAL